MNYGDLTYLEIMNKVEEGYMIIVSTGCTEQQGPHLSVDFDTWFAYELMEEVSQKLYAEKSIKTLVAPVIPYGTAFEHVSFGSGYVNIPQSVFEELLYHTFKSFAQQGFKKMFLWTGCGGHYLSDMVGRFNKDFESVSSIETLPHPFYDAWCTFMSPTIPGGHADSFTTSISLYKHPEKVREELINNPNSAEPDWENPDLDFRDYSETGVIGDPTYASAELGKKLWDETVSRLVQMFETKI